MLAELDSLFDLEKAVPGKTHSALNIFTHMTKTGFMAGCFQEFQFKKALRGVI